MSFNEQENQIIKFGLEQGKSRREVEAALSRYRKQANNRVGSFGTGGSPDSDNFISNIRQGIQGGADAFERGVDRKEKIDERGNVFSRAFGNVANTFRTGGEAIASGVEGLVRAVPGGDTAVDLTEKVAEKGIEAGIGGARFVDEKTGSVISETASELPEGVKTFAGDVGNLALGGLTIGGTLAGGSAGSAIARTGSKKLESAFNKLTPEEAITVAQKGTDEATGFSLTRMLGKDKEITIPANSKEAFIDLADRGFDNATAIRVATMDTADKGVARGMLELAERKKNPTDIKSANINTYPIDIVGSKVVSRYDGLNTVRKQVGEKLDEVAQSLEGKQFDTTPVQASVSNALDKLKITRNEDGTFNFDNSIIKRNQPAQKRIIELVEDSNALNGSAAKTHTFKQSIDDIVDFSKQQEGLTGTMDNVFKEVRASADNALDTTFKEYDLVNKQYSEIKGALDKVSDAFGTNKQGQIDMQRSASALRRVFGKSSKRGELEDAIAVLQETSQRYGIKAPEDLIQLTKFANTLEDIYGSQSLYGLTDEVAKGAEKAIKEASSIPGMIANPLDSVAKGAGALVGKVLKQSDEDKVNALMNALKN